MNINDLTLGELLEIQKMTLPGATGGDSHPLIGEPVLVRDHRAGIHVGTLDAVYLSDKRVTMTDARKVWYWEGAGSCHGIAARGLKLSSKVAPLVARVELLDVVEVVAMTSCAVESIAACPEWKP